MPSHSLSNAQRYTVKDFHAEFPDDETCLEWLKESLYPDGIHCAKCERVTKHHRVMSRKSYSCQNCGHHVHPTADTIFHKSSTPLTTWFHAIFLMSQSRCGISAMELMRQTGVTYKTAWRMFNRIRNMLLDENETLPPLHTEVEADETFLGGKYRHRRVGHPGQDSDLTPVFGLVQRGGKVVARVVPDTRQDTLMPIVRSFVMPSTLIFTDESSSYPVGLRKGGYGHKRIRHSARIYVKGNVHTQTIEGFFGNVKNGIRGNYHSVSRKWLQGYLNEYAYRYNHRDDAAPMFKLFLRRVVKAA